MTFTNQTQGNSFSSSSTSLSSTTTLPMIHSTFRDAMGETLVPHGLEWGMRGRSHVRFIVPGKANSNNNDAVDTRSDDDDNASKAFMESAEFRQDLVQAYNRWCFAKDLPFQTIEDIASIERQGPHHIKVEWTKNNDVEKVVKHEDVEKLLRNDEATQSVTQCSAAEVWVNGELIGMLDGPDTVESLVAAIPKNSPNKLCYKRSDGRIRIDRYYRGGLRRPQAWDHIWDCVVALEDPVILDDDTIIGTATLRDWIMGGNLTSRLWVRDMGSSIVFQRPLYKDDLKTADRYYEVTNEKDPEKVAKARGEIARLRHLAKLCHPFEAEFNPLQLDGSGDNVTKDPLEDVRNKLRENRKRGKFFGL